MERTESEIENEKYIYTFNTLVQFLAWGGDSLGNYSHTRDECERTLMPIEAAVKQMKRLVDKMN